ncbi:MAG: hypothetical protein DI605_20510 [Sphingomonas sp.]|nr:MAG: hypothetical protein DI605_20510 [Sphingomonas sp.]
MYNLLVRGAGWSARGRDLQGRDTLGLDRIFEATEERIGEAYHNGDRLAFDRLLTLPCLFMTEGRDRGEARVGTIIRARAGGRDVMLDYVYDADVPPLANELLFERLADFDIGRDEFTRTHWAVKDVDLYRALLRTVRPRRQRPTVFTIEEHERIEPALVSAMMPFDAAFAGVYASIQEACEAVGLRCRRADDIWENPAIIQDVVSLIDRSRVVVADCTGRNPNVFYEAGIAHTLGREVILITQNAADIPFDLRHLRYVPYLNNAEGRADLATALRGRMETLLGH